MLMKWGVTETQARLPGRRKERKDAGINFRVFVPVLTALPAKKPRVRLQFLNACREDVKNGKATENDSPIFN
jgi:hypothetical protein